MPNRKNCHQDKKIFDLIYTAKQPRKYQLQYISLIRSFLELKTKLKTGPV